MESTINHRFFGKKKKLAEVVDTRSICKHTNESIQQLHRRLREEAAVVFALLLMNLQSSAFHSFSFARCVFVPTHLSARFCS